jgi:thiol-disulfide isomerase/thioredoxin
MSIHLLNNKVSNNNDDGALSTIKKGNVLVLYYANWCPHCVTFKPMWHDFINKVKGGACKKNITIVSVEHEDLQKPENSALEGEAQGFPTLKFYSKPNLGGSQIYEEERTIDGLINFVNKHGSSSVGTQTKEPVTKGKKGKATKGKKGKATKGKKGKQTGGAKRTRKAKKEKKLTKPQMNDKETEKYTKKAISKIHKELKKSKTISQKLIKDMKKEFKL